MNAKYVSVDNQVPVATAESSEPLIVEGTNYFINLKTVNEQTFKIVCSPDIKLGEFRLEVEKATGVNPANQRLISNGRILSAEEDKLNLESGSFIHLAPTDSSAHQDRDDNDSIDSDDKIEPGALVQAYLSQMNGLAWVVVVFFTLLSWRLFMTIAFEEDSQHTSVQVTVSFFVISLFGMCVGFYGLHAASTRNRTPSATTSKLRTYTVLLSLLALFYFVISYQTVDGGSLLSIFILQSMFWYCILQAQLTQRAFRASIEDSRPHVTEPPTAVVPVPITYQQQTETELTEFSSSNRTTGLLNPPRRGEADVV